MDTAVAIAWRAGLSKCKQGIQTFVRACASCELARLARKRRFAAGRGRRWVFFAAGVAPCHGSRCLHWTVLVNVLATVLAAVAVHAACAARGLFGLACVSQVAFAVRPPCGRRSMSPARSLRLLFDEASCFLARLASLACQARRDRLMLAPPHSADPDLRLQEHHARILHASLCACPPACEARKPSQAKRAFRAMPITFACCSPSRTRSTAKRHRTCVAAWSEEEAP